MKKLFSLLALAGVFASGNTLAADGTITFDGAITSTTCVLTTGTKDLTFSLGKFTINQLKVAGDVTTAVRPTTGSITLTGCGASKQVALTVGRQTAGTDNINNGFMNTATTTPATNVIAQLVDLDATGTQVPLTIDSVAVTKTSNAAGNITFNLGARFRATGASTVGNFTSDGNYTLSYL